MNEFVNRVDILGVYVPLWLIIKKQIPEDESNFKDITTYIYTRLFTETYHHVLRAVLFLSLGLCLRRCF